MDNFQANDNRHSQEKWVRADDGALFGVCKGLAQSMGISVGLTRLVLVLSVLCFGFGFGLYILLAIALPKKSEMDQAYNKRILGVCSYLAKNNQMDVGLVRFLALVLLFASFGFTFIAYVIAYMMLPEDEKSSASRSNPSVPPSTT
ncbi:MAG TPA: hypothetical protein DCL41_07905 [Bdellovibrionales bacterium]|nr:hypothetical protein [Pseudobdellovibrionaceae bacterium]HAG91780.1 hypothetical protein [Bdellovibrionales bacterium]|tara:strand:- start:6413 stop:6850 length:438 start_codon:yes stop_codon:yes gene_type:complete